MPLTCTRPSREATLLHAARAICVLTTEPDHLRYLDTPEGCVRYGNVLFAASALLEGGQTQLDALAEQSRCDAIDVMRNADGGFRFRLGVRLSWKMLWHDHDYRLWRPRDGRAASFASADPAHEMGFHITDDRIQPWLDERPWANSQDRAIGQLLGAAAVRRLMEGR